MLLTSPAQANETALSDDTISALFATRTRAWHQWAEEFAHRDTNRLQSSLHPLQLRELCEHIKHFVRLTDNGELPERLLSPTDNDEASSTGILLQGMLANFIISETLASPFWVFDAISANALELESPSVPSLNSMSPIGFRMDLAMWNSSIAPPRDVKSPRPMAGVTNRPAEGLRKPPRLVTSIQPLGPSTDPTTELLTQNVPSRQTMESLYQLLSNGMPQHEPQISPQANTFC
jgi:hypothetical protein